MYRLSANVSFALTNSPSNEEEEEEEEKEKVCYHNEASFLAAGGQAGTGQCCDDG